MPTLLLMRHAKSDWSDPGCSDHDRPLNPRGKRDAPRMGRWLKQQGLHPVRIVTSSAKRARKTATRVAQSFERDLPTDIRSELYHASPEMWVDVLAELPSDADCVLAVGHNPGLEELLHELVGRYERMPTAAIAVLDVGSRGWETFSDPEPAVSLRAIGRPKELRDEEF